MSETKPVPLEYVDKLAKITEQISGVRSGIGKALSPFALTLEQVLLLQKMQAGTQGVATLAEHYKMNPSEMRSVLQWLAGLDLVQFVGMPSRGYQLTDLGRRVLEAKLPELERLAYFVEKRIPSEHLDELVTLFQALNSDFLSGL